MIIDCLFDDFKIVEEIFTFIHSNIHNMNFITSKSLQHCFSIIANIFYYHSNDQVRNHIIDKIFKLFYKAELNIEFKEANRTWLFDEFEKLQANFTNLENISFPKEYIYHKSFVFAYISTKLLYDCVNGPNPSKNSKNIIFISDYSLCKTSNNTLITIHQQLINLLIATTRDNSCFYKYNDFSIECLAGLTQSTNISNETYGGSQTVDSKLSDLADYFLLENRAQDKRLPANIRIEYYKYLVVLCFNLTKLIIKYFKRVAFAQYFNKENTSIKTHSYPLMSISTIFKVFSTHDNSIETTTFIFEHYVTTMLLLYEISFIKNNVYLSSCYLINDYQNYLFYFDNLTTITIATIKRSNTKVNEISDFINKNYEDKTLIKTLLKFLFFLFKYYIKAIDSKYQNIEENSFKQLKNCAKKLVTEINFLNLNLIYLNQDLKNLYIDLVSKLDLDGKLTTHSVIESKLHASLIANISKEHTKLFSYIERAIVDQEKVTSSPETIKTVKCKLNTFIKKEKALLKSYIKRAV
jgi:hypothetical protein